MRQLTRARPTRRPEDGAEALARVMASPGTPAHSALARRITTILAALGQPSVEADGLLSALASTLEGAGPEELWLALSVLTATFPDRRAVLRALRHSRLDGAVPALSQALVDSGQWKSSDWPVVEVVTGSTVVDLHHTSEFHVTTGIQRVVRETVRRWHRDHELLLVGWTRGFGGMRRLSSEEAGRALHGVRRFPVAGAVAADGDGVVQSVLVPWRCTVLLPELAAEGERALRYHAMAWYARSAMAVIGYDCVPLMASETSADGMAAGFDLYLAALAKFDRLAAISDAAAQEFMGWRAMLAGSGRTGPDIRSIGLTVEPQNPSDASVQAARDLITIGSLPVVLAVGSHEPRKNHLAVLQAAELLWRDGIEFTLTFVGGQAWKSEVFTAQVEALQAAHRPVQTIRALPDELLWAAYRVAYCTVFVSVHEGFGLPVAESLASGTPVVTSNSGTMLEIAGRGGAIVVDPADDDAIAAALRRLLLQPALRDRLGEEGSSIEWRSWDDYAGEVWAYLTGGETHAAPDAQNVRVEPSAASPTPNSR